MCVRLAVLLGDVLKEQVGDNLFSAVEELRLLLLSIESYTRNQDTMSRTSDAQSNVRR
jgi:hypothetical protein